MKVRKRNGFDIDLKLHQMSKLRTVNADGSIGMKGFGVLDEFESYLRTAIEIEGKTDAFVRRVIAKAMHEEQNPTEASFIKNCRKYAFALDSTGQKKFKVLFPIFGSLNSLTGRRKWGDVTIDFSIRRDTRFAAKAIKDRTEQLEEFDNSTTKKMQGLEHLPLARCSVQAIDIHDAFEQAESAISKELGLYSLSTSRGRFIFSSEPDKPINTILLAPHMTVHSTTGALSANMYWFNSWPTSLSEKVRTRKETKTIVNRADRVRAALKNLPWKAKAEDALARHYAAYAQCDLEASFLDAWRLLEAIGGHPREKGETLVKRAAWFFEHRDEHFQTGLHLMHRRHLISHGRPVRDESNEALSFQMKKFLEPLLFSFLTNPFNFESLEEFWSFCDLPVDRRARLRQSYLLQSSVEFRRES